MGNQYKRVSGGKDEGGLKWPVQEVDERGEVEIVQLHAAELREGRIRVNLGNNEEGGREDNEVTCIRELEGGKSEEGFNWPVQVFEKRGEEKLADSLINRSCNQC